MKLVKGNKVKADDKPKIDMRQMCTYLCHHCANRWDAPYIGDVAQCPSCSKLAAVIPESGRIERAPRV